MSLKVRPHPVGGAFAAILACGILAGCESEPPGSVPEGLWGGLGLVMTVHQGSADAEFDCATGHIPEPVVLDASGRFVVAGTMTLGYGGPVREGELPDVRAAVYQGRLSDDVLQMTVQVQDIATIWTVFELRRGDPGLLRRCL